MKTIGKLLMVGVAVTFSATIVTPALADRNHDHHDRHRHYDYAKVIAVSPIYRMVEVAVPRESCWQEQEQRPVRRQVRSDNAEKMLVGGLIGGVIGHHLGQGDDRDIATIAGTLIGAAVGHDQGTTQGQTREYYVENSTHCRTDTDYRTEQQLDGYQVTYRYRGELYDTRMDQPPGDRIRIPVKRRNWD